MTLTEKVDYAKGTLSGAQIKRIAVVSMVIDHVGGYLVRNWFMLSNYNIMTSETANMHMLFYWIIKVCDILGSMAFPVFCFLIAEGFFHSKAPRKYALRMFVFAVLTEIPFNLVHRMGVWYPGLQNVMFTLAVSILTLYVASISDSKFKGSKFQLPVRILIVILGMGLAFLLRGEYVFLGVLAISLFYYLRSYTYLRLLAFVPLAVPSFWSLLAIPVILLYNGKRGKQNKYFFYVFYPAHFLLIYAIMVLWK